MFHEPRRERLRSLTCAAVLRRKNPYLFRARNIQTASELAAALLEAHLSSSEETKFGGFLEEVAIFACETAYNGQKSTTTGMDLDFIRDGIRYVVAIKSGPHWGNSSQRSKLRQDLQAAIKVARQSNQHAHIRGVEGICYGAAQESDDGHVLKKQGRCFWEFISGVPNLHMKIMEPLEESAEDHAIAFDFVRQELLAAFEQHILLNFCGPVGNIDWDRILESNQ